LCGDALDALLAHSLAALVEEGVIDLELIAPDALKVQALADVSSASRHHRFEALAAAAAARINALRDALDRDDPVADERHNRAARGRITQQLGARVNAALMRIKEPLQPEDWLFGVANEMDVEDRMGHGIGVEGVTAFTDFGIENLADPINIHKGDPTQLKRSSAGTAQNTPAVYAEWISYVAKVTGCRSSR